MAKYFRSLAYRWIKRFPEYSLFRNEEERSAALKLAGKCTTGTAAFIIGYCVVQFATMNATDFIIAYVWPTLPRFADFLVSVAALSLVFSAYLYSTLWVYRRRIERVLRERLLELGIPVCLHCGYDLRGQTVPRCPECGRGFDPALLSKVEPTSASGKPTK